MRASVAVRGDGVRQLGARLLEALEGEQDRWFLWLPVLFGLGIALYFGMSTEPSLIAAMAALTVALTLRIVWRRGAASMLWGESRRRRRSALRRRSSRATGWPRPC